MAGGLSIEVEEDVQMVDNTAAPTLFSPGMWVQRPQRTAAMAPQAVQVAAAQHNNRPPAAPVVERSGAAKMGSPLADPDLAYLNLGYDRDTAEKEYIKQDSEHMEALEAAYGRLRQQNSAMTEQLKGVTAAAEEVMDENRAIKGLLAMLQVQRDDFVFNPQKTIGAQQEAIGLRLLDNLEGSPHGPCRQPSLRKQRFQRARAAAASQQQQQQQAAADQGKQLQGAEAGAQQQQQPHQAAQAEQPEASPGCLLPLNTPGGLLRTASPKIGAHRFDPLSAAGGKVGTDGKAPPTAVPASPYDFPAESQIAAAALTAKQGDTAAALLTLLDKAIEARMEQQQAAQLAQQQGQEAERQGSQGRR